MKVFKWTLQVAGEQTLLMPAGARILSVQTQHGGPQVWALVDPEAPLEPRRLVIVGTGNPIRASLGAFIGTFQLHEGALVFHVFEQA